MASCLSPITWQSTVLNSSCMRGIWSPSGSVCESLHVQACSRGFEINSRTYAAGIIADRICAMPAPVVLNIVLSRGWGIFFQLLSSCLLVVAMFACFDFCCRSKHLPWRRWTSMVSCRARPGVYDELPEVAEGNGEGSSIGDGEWMPESLLCTAAAQRRVRRRRVENHTHTPTHISQTPFLQESWFWSVFWPKQRNIEST